jgi:hypothetical protein
MNLIELSHQVLYETLNVLFGKRARIWWQFKLRGSSWLWTQNELNSNQIKDIIQACRSPPIPESALSTTQADYVAGSPRTVAAWHQNWTYTRSIAFQFSVTSKGKN